jgi:hypothetical protein
MLAVWNPAPVEEVELVVAWELLEVVAGRLVVVPAARVVVTPATGVVSPAAVVLSVAPRREGVSEPLRELPETLTRDCGRASIGRV